MPKCFKSIIGYTLAASLMAVSDSAAAQEPANWARVNSRTINSLQPDAPDTDLEALRPIVGSAKVVGLGETAHAMREYAQMRIRVLKFLVEKMGFRALVLESGIIEGRQVERYIQGDPSVSLTTALTQGITHGGGRVEGVRDLLLWMRGYNLAHGDPAAKVHFYGMDLSLDGDSPLHPLQSLQPLLKKMDPEFTERGLPELLELASRANRLVDKVNEYYRGKGEDHINGNFLDPVTTLSFEQLSEKEQALLEQGVQTLIRRIVDRKEQYLKVGSPEGYRWAECFARITSQMIRDLRSRQSRPFIYNFDETVALLGGIYSNPRAELTIDQRHTFKSPRTAEEFKEYFRARDTRELALAENLVWVQSMHGRTLLYGHNMHLMKDQVDITTEGVHVGRPGSMNAGQFVSRIYGRDYVLIAQTMDKLSVPPGTPFPADFVPTSQCGDCLEKTLVENAPHRHGVGLIVDLRSSKGAARKWLSGDIANRYLYVFQRFSPLKAYDATLLLNQVGSDSEW